MRLPSPFSQPPIWREGRLGLEVASLLRDPLFRGEGVRDAGGQPAFLIPGFLAADDYDSADKCVAPALQYAKKTQDVGLVNRTMAKSKEIANPLWASVLDNLGRRERPVGPYAQLCFNFNNPLVRRLAVIQDRRLLQRSIQMLYDTFAATILSSSCLPLSVSVGRGARIRYLTPGRQYRFATLRALRFQSPAKSARCGSPSKEANRR